METIITTSDKHGKNPLTITIARTDEAEAAALAFLETHCNWTVGASDYRVIFDVENFALEISEALAELISPTCVHGMSAQLCMGPDHFPSREQEMAWA